MKKRFFLFALFFCAGAHVLPAQEIRILSLEETIYLSGTQSLAAAISHEKIKESLAQLSQAQSLFLPKADGSLSQSRQTRNFGSQGIPLNLSDPVVGPFNSFDARVRGKQMVLDASAVSRLLAVIDGVKLSEAEQIKAKQDAMALAGSLYLDAELHDKNLEWARKWLIVTRTSLRLSHIRLRQAQAAKSDILKAKTAYKRAVSQIYLERSRALTARQHLAVYLGWDPETLIEFQEHPSAKILTLLGGQELDKILENQPDLQSAKLALKQKKKIRIAQWAEYFPKLSVAADYGKSGSDPRDSEATYSIGVEASMPFFDGGERAARAREAQSREREMEIQLAHLKNKVKSDILSGQKTLISAEAALEAEEMAVIAANQKMKETVEKQNLGMASAWDTLYENFELASAKIQLEAASNNYLLSLISLLRSQGQMELLSSKGIKNS